MPLILLILNPSLKKEGLLNPALKIFLKNYKPVYTMAFLWYLIIHFKVL
jgi:hypothetical protein